MRNDITRRGSRDYEPDQYERVKAFLLDHVGKRRAVGEKYAADELHIAGRTIRAVTNDLEMDEILALGGPSDLGLFVAEYQEEVEDKSRTLAAAANSTLLRVRHREHWMQQLPRLQEGLFPP